MKIIKGKIIPNVFPAVTREITGRSNFQIIEVNIDPTGVLDSPIGTIAVYNAVAPARYFYKTGDGISDWSEQAFNTIPNNFIFVGTKNDLPESTGGIITLADEVTYFITGDIDLEGERIVCGEDSVIIGGSSENSIIRSTGLIGEPLITSNYSLPIRNITITSDIALDLDAQIHPGAALDWYGVNFTNCNSCGVIKNYNNFIMSDSAFINSGSLTFDGTFATIGFSQSIFTPSNNSTAIIIAPTANITRRFRMIFSSVVALSARNASGISATNTSFQNNESFILDTVNFSGGGNYLPIINSDDNKAFLFNCVGVNNSGNVSEYYMINNLTSTSCVNQNQFYKVAGTTTSGPVIQKFTNENNKSTYVGALVGFFKVTCFMTVVGQANQVIAARVAKNGSTVDSSDGRMTTNSGGRAESLAIQSVVSLSYGNYIEIYISNTSSNNTNITVENMQVIIERLN